MSLHIIIDGYNLIRHSDIFSDLDRRDIQLGRDALIDTLAEYKKIKPHRITIVFDGLNAPIFSQHRDRIKGIEIKFSRGGESADSVIKKISAREKEKALIVSSDRDIVDFAASQGSATIDSILFAQKIAMASYVDKKAMDEDEGWIPTTKKKGPNKRLSKRQRRNRIKIKKL
ncbi:MAG: NYN domain-containing protein [Desulfobacterales bacterium]|nr:NYN domain-containing protein [Desulfobacterales bacterium]